MQINENKFKKQLGYERQIIIKDQQLLKKLYDEENNKLELNKQIIQKISSK